LAEEVTLSKRPDIIGPGQLALGWWVRWGGGMGDWELRGGGWHIFYLRPVPTSITTSITLAFFKSMHSAHGPCKSKKGQQFHDFEVSNKNKKTCKGCFLSRMVNKFRIFIKILRNTYGLHFTDS
jgi:hypothetical protein